MAMPRWIRLGEVGVDSAMLYVIDPSYLRGWKDAEHYQECIDVAHTQPKRGGEVFDGVVFGAGYGDGEYPVFARINTHGVIVEVRIIMDGQNYPDGSED
jgi:hypothetical protein